MAKKAAVLLANGFEEIEAVTPIDILRRAGVQVRVIGVGGLSLKGARGLTVAAETEAAVPDLDLLVLPGGMPGSKNLGESSAAKRIAESLHASGGILAAICAAPVYTLGAWGMLSEKRATCFPGMEEMLPRDVVRSRDPVVVDGSVVTARSAGVAMDFSLALVSLLVGKDAAKEISDSIGFSI